ncbi:MAG: porin family protein [Bacteroides sp.]|nr:porin family protein [Bacteroides sp.]
MKKIIILTAMFSVVSFMHLNAQNRVSFGVGLEGNVTNVKLSNLQGAKAKFSPGASVSGFSDIAFGTHFSLRPELRIGYTEAKVKVNEENLKFKYASVEIPVYALGRYQTAAGTLFAGVGPHMGYGFSADSETEKIASGSPGENILELDHWYAGGSAMAGFEFRNRISVRAGYQLSYDLHSHHKINQKKTRTLSLGVGYRF